MYRESSEESFKVMEYLGTYVLLQTTQSPNESEFNQIKN